MEKLTQDLINMAMTLGACKVGISTTKTLAGGPPSVDLSYVLPEAKSAISFALPFDQDLIGPYFKKEDHKSLETNKVRTTTLANGIALEIAEFLQQQGCKALPLGANFVYRMDSENGLQDMLPPISHRYLALASGIGHMGYSGNIIIDKYGSAIVLASVVTDQELTATEPLPEAQNYCDNCRLCLSVCSSGYVDPVEKTTITLNGREFSYGRRRSHSRCFLVCGGLTGLNASGKWSTWSPARFTIPKNDAGFQAAAPAATEAYLQRPKFEGGFFICLISGARMEYTCSNCHFICHPDPEVRKARYQMLLDGGVVIEEPDGSRRAVSPEEGKAYIEALLPERKKLYTAEPGQ
ncbi:MAG: epoxyqueuosine reductase [Deltaproteobacteria bacterium]|nr:epoxyqueuosine reductase [Deltaproteobacteria bacterium]